VPAASIPRAGVGRSAQSISLAPNRTRSSEPETMTTVFSTRSSARPLTGGVRAEEGSCANAPAAHASTSNAGGAILTSAGVLMGVMRFFSRTLS